MNKKVLQFFSILTICFLASGLFTSCVSLREQHDFDLDHEFVYVPEEFVWETITDEIQYTVVNFPESPVIYHVAKIDLNSTNLEIVEYVADRPENKKKAIVIDKFYERTKATVGFNTSPFKVSNRLALGFTWMPSKYENVGIHIADGVVLSPAVERYCALAFFKESDGSYRAEIFDHQTEAIGKITSLDTEADMTDDVTPVDAGNDVMNDVGAFEVTDDVIPIDAEEGMTDNVIPMNTVGEGIPDFAFGGFFTILRDGEKRKFPANNYNSRTGAGIADDGKTLYVMIVEGEKQKTSLGLSYPACADVFAALGCDVAMQFDGGGSSGLFVNGKNVLTYKPIRKNPSFMGIKVRGF